MVDIECEVCEKVNVPVRKVMTQEGRKLLGIYNPDRTKAEANIAAGEVYGAMINRNLVPVIAGDNGVMYPIDPLKNPAEMRSFEILRGTYHTPARESHATVAQVPDKPQPATERVGYFSW